MPKPDLRKVLGRQGEQIAENWLVSRGYQLLQRNYTLTGGQIDLVMYSPQGNLVFVEVKTRWPDRFSPRAPGRAPTPNRPSPPTEHRIGPRQIQSLRRAASHFLAENPFPFADWQLDLFWITIHTADRPSPSKSAPQAEPPKARRSSPTHNENIIAKVRHYQNVLEI